MTFRGGAAGGEVQASLFAAGAAVGEVLTERKGATCSVSQQKMLVACLKSNLVCELTVSFSDHGRIILGSWSDHGRIVSSIVNDVSPVCLQSFSLQFCSRSIW